MPKQRRYPGLLVAAVVAAAFLAVQAARADTSSAYTAKPTINTAYTLRAGEAQLGLVVQGYGIADRFSISTALLGWILPAFTEVFAPNVGARYRFLDAGRWSFAFDTGLAWIRVRDANLVGTTRQNSDSIIVPLKIFATNRAPFGLLSTLEVNYAAGEATLQDGAVIREFDSGVVTSSLQLAAALEYPVAPRFAVTLTGRVVAFVPKGQIDVVAVIDESTEVIVRGTITSENVAGSYNVIGGFAY
ncbi:MAG: hypothetical protein JSV06_10310, partial [Myxococcales bacterium]